MSGQSTSTQAALQSNAPSDGSFRIAKDLATDRNDQERMAAVVMEAIRVVEDSTKEIKGVLPEFRRSGHAL